MTASIAENKRSRVSGTSPQKGQSAPFLARSSFPGIAPTGIVEQLFVGQRPKEFDEVVFLALGQTEGPQDARFVRVIHVAAGGIMIATSSSVARLPSCM